MALVPLYLLFRADRPAGSDVRIDTGAGAGPKGPRAQRERLPKQRRWMSLGCVVIRGGPGRLRQGECRYDYDDHESEPSPSAHLIVIGVPTGIRAASRTMSAFRRRMQP